MNIDKHFDEIEEGLESYRAVIVKGSFDEESDNLRSLSEAKQILEVLKTFTIQIYDLIENYPSLETVVEKNFGKLKNFLKRENLTSTCLQDDYLFVEEQQFPLVQGQVLEQELLDNYKNSFSEWIDDIKNDHIKSQELIFESFSTDLKQSALACHCNKCSADFRATLRDTIFQSQKDLIDKAASDIDNLLLEKEIIYISDFVSRLKKNLEKNIGKVRYKLKRGSLNKLDSDIKNYFKLHFGYNSELGKVYQERLISFFNSLLIEEDHSPDLVTADEYDRFFSQLGIGIWRNPNALKKDYRKLVRAVMTFKRKDISATILKEYLGEFWIHSPARRKKRKIIYHMGPTNSGKTYNAIQALSKAKKGCYLAPLRLLASELFDTLNDLGCKTTLLTGEEVIDVEGATHTSSTIEMAKLSEDFDCVVIDEIQMITDSQRGWAWTRALVNINADEVHLCGDPSVFELVEQILALTGDEIEVHKYERMTSLTIMDRPIRLVDLEKNDALIVFSRRNALKYKRDLENLDFKVSIVYGRLSPEVRREQARKFDEGETDIIVATDAIAMGMNLPIKRVIFSAVAKFWDGKEFPLTNSELKQIAGRAGRFQRFPEGFVTSLQKVEDGPEVIRNAINSELEQKEFAMVGPDLDIFRSVNLALEDNNLKTLSLSEFLRLFNTMIFKKPFYCVDLKEMIELAETVEDADTLESLSDAEIFGFACAPVNQGLVEHLQYYIWILNHYVGKKNILSEEIDVDTDDIDYLETAIKCVELYQWLARHFDNNYFSFDIEALGHNKGLAVERLNHLLSEKVSQKCSSCGCKLDDDHKYNICETCFAERRGRQRGSFRRDKPRDNTSKAGGGNEKPPFKDKKSKFSKKKKSKKTKASSFKRG